VKNICPRRSKDPRCLCCCHSQLSRSNAPRRSVDATGRELQPSKAIPQSAGQPAQRHPRQTAANVVDTMKKTAHMVIRGGETSVPANTLFFRRPTRSGDPPQIRRRSLSAQTKSDTYSPHPRAVRSGEATLRSVGATPFASRQRHLSESDQSAEFDRCGYSVGTWTEKIRRGQQLLSIKEDQSKP
jgi:hypothetical protein